jgi:TRAP transporter TAXI family solute receptor
MPRETTRRGCLRAAGAAAAVALAGCGGNGGGGPVGGGGPRTFTWYYGRTNQTVAQEIKEAVDASAQNVELRLRKGESPVSNLQAVNEENADFAVVSGDVAFFARNGTGIDAVQGRTLRNLRGVMALYPQPITIMAPPGITADTVSELGSDPRVNTGEVGTPTEVNALRILDASQLSQYNTAHSSLSEATTQVANGDVRAAFAVGDWPIETVQQAAGNVKLLGLEQETHRSVVESTEWLVDEPLPAGVYDGIDYGVDTVSRNAVVITNSELSDGITVRIMDAITSNAADIRSAYGYISVENAKKGVPIGFKDGADNFLG